MSCSLDWLVYTGACIQRAVEAGGERMSWDDWGYWDDSSDDEYMRQRYQVCDPYADIRAQLEAGRARRAQERAEEDRKVEQFKQDYPEELKAIEDEARKYARPPSFFGRSTSNDVLERDVQWEVRRRILTEVAVIEKRERELRTLKPSQDPEEVDFFSDALRLLRDASIDCMMEDRASPFDRYWATRSWEFLNHVILVRKREFEHGERTQLSTFYNRMMTAVSAVMEQVGVEVALQDDQKFDQGDDWDKRELLADFLESRLIPHLQASNEAQAAEAAAAALQAAEQEEKAAAQVEDLTPARTRGPISRQPHHSPEGPEHDVPACTIS